ncbi:MAG: hypothetical protein GX751_10620, partial [Desulfuromonadaceae bacterium]|nr:hypothetical protein [Desulfuromonadaceae bacterium]
MIPAINLFTSGKEPKKMTGLGDQGELMNKKGFKVKLLSRALLIIGIIAFNAAVSTGSDKASSHREYTSSGNYFRCTIPDGWSVHAPSGFGLSEDEKKVYGAVFSGPYVEGQAAPEIS